VCPYEDELKKLRNRVEQLEAAAGVESIANNPLQGSGVKQLLDHKGAPAYYRPAKSGMPWRLTFVAGPLMGLLFALSLCLLPIAAGDEWYSLTAYLLVLACATIGAWSGYRSRIHHFKYYLPVAGVTGVSTAGFFVVLGYILLKGGSLPFAPSLIGALLLILSYTLISAVGYLFGSSVGAQFRDIRDNSATYVYLAQQLLSNRVLQAILLAVITPILTQFIQVLLPS